MKATYINFEKQVTLKVNLNQGNKDQKLFDWLEENHSDIFWDIEMHEKGVRGVQIMGNEISFSGDNGIFFMERVRIQEI